ncbi:hypothetical protein [Nostoc sp.]
MPIVPVLPAIEDNFEQKEVLSESGAPEVLDIKPLAKVKKSGMSF